MARSKAIPQPVAASNPQDIIANTPQIDTAQKPKTRAKVETPQASQQNDVIMGGVIGITEIKEATETLRKYKQGKQNLEQRIIENERWYRQQHWDSIRDKKSGQKDQSSRPEPASAWLFNLIENKHADAMDNYPEAAILPREQSDESTAELLSEVVPCVLEYNRFEGKYNNSWRKKLIGGTGAYSVLWNKNLENGLGDIDINNIDILNIFWQPGINDIQDSANIFTVSLLDNKELEQEYPQLKGKLGGSNIDIGVYVTDDTIDTSEKSQVVDWYYKRKIFADNGTFKEVLHYVKFCGDEVLYASENDPEKAQIGWYEHAKYPFVFDPLYPIEGTPCGFGFVDIEKDNQMYIDKMGQAMLENTLACAKIRFLAKQDGAVKAEDITDLSKAIIYTNGGGVSDDNFKQIKIDPMQQFVMNAYESKINELKETSGNRDFNSGGTASGVTAASAIAALQEAGNKGSRDMIKGSYRAFTEVVYFCIELMRQFYDFERSFRISQPNGDNKYVNFSKDPIALQELSPASETLAQDPTYQPAYRKPIFDIKVKAQKANPFSRMAQNELAKELYKGGFFDPARAEQSLAALEIMDFEGKDKIKSIIQSNSQMMQAIQTLTMQNQQLLTLMQTPQMPGNGLDMQGGNGQTVQDPNMAAAQNANTLPGTGAAMGAIK